MRFEELIETNKTSFFLRIMNINSISVKISEKLTFLKEINDK